MEYHPEHKRHETHCIPVPMRSFLFGIMGQPFFEKFGKGYYRWAATMIARSFYRFLDVQEVYLVGGGLARCRPGVSDLDFVVIIDPVYEKEFLLLFQMGLKKLNRLFPVLGEVHLVRSENWAVFKNSGCATKAWFERSHVFAEGNWKVQGEKQWSPCSRSETLKSRFALSLLHYWKAHHYRCESLKKHSSYFLCHFNRDISKCLDFLHGKGLRLRTQSTPDDLMCEAFWQLDAVALTILSQPVPETDIKLILKDAGGERFKIEVAQRRLFESIQKIGADLNGICKSTIPSAFSFDLKNKTAESRTFMHGYYRTVSHLPNPPVLLSPSIISLLKFGLGWGGPVAHLDWLLPYESHDPQFLHALKFFSKSAIGDRLLLNTTLFRGKIVSANTEKLHKLFHELFDCYYVLSRGILTNDKMVINSELKREFPHLRRGQSSTYLEALNEIEKFVQRVLS